MACRRKTVAQGLFVKLPEVGGDGAVERQPGRQPESGSGAIGNVTPEQHTPRGVLSQDPHTISFGGSGAKFTALRNRRGVRGGQDGLIQKRLNLTLVNGGNGKFSLSLGRKRKVTETEKP